ncbi:hypothetical protein VTJ83DRAFT_5151 [Remersonia thermophila]|uniref:alpha-glucosidase n=1 Tax=Remersonia thermophila TaxID=72144 RepID=A0ABR4DCZ3_9PEZI
MVCNRYQFPCRPEANPKAVVSGSKGSSHYRFTVLTDRLLRFEWSEDGGFEDRASTLALFRWFPAPHYRVVEAKDRLEIITDHFHLAYDKNRFSSQGLSATVADDTWRYDGASYGDLGGTARTLDGAYGRIKLEPGVLSRRAYAVLDDSRSMLFDKGWIATRRPGRVDGYLFAYNRDHKAAIRDFYRLSGSQPVLPRWALGNWWSRYHAYTAREYLDLMDRFARQGIPLSVAVVDMDWHKVDVPPQYGSGWTGYSWNRDLFPDPDAFLRELRDRHLRVTLNDHPADGIRPFEDLYPAVAKALGYDVARGETIPFDCTDRAFLDAYFDVLKLALEKQGVDFWWIDWQQGDRTKIPGVDPLWVLNHYHYLTSRRSLGRLERPLTFSRYAGPGSHRYPIGFSGDQQITWEGLAFQPEFTATASNIGYGWWSHDIGGHWAGVRSSDMAVRWVQLGVFSPIMRLHSSKCRWNSKEPWSFEEEPGRIMKDWLVLRHRLIPYLYTMNIRASYDAEPLVQPMYWNHKEEEAYTVPAQYYFGPNLIVAPITSPNSPATLMGAVRAWLPPGRFVDLLRPHLVYDGGRYLHLHRDLTRLPLLAKEGTILPIDTTHKLANGAPRPTEITVLLVVGKDAHFELVEEPEQNGHDHHHHRPPGDGDDDDDDKNESAATASRPALSSFVRTPITWNQDDGVLVIGPEWNGSGKWRQWNVKLVGYTGSAVRSNVSGFRVAQEDGSTTISLGNVHRWDPDGFEIFLGKNLQLDVVDVKSRVFDALHRCEMEYMKKDPVWDAVNGSDGVPARVRRLLALDVDPSVKNAVMEIWAADGRAPGSAAGHEKWVDTRTGEVDDLTELLKEYVIV